MKKKEINSSRTPVYRDAGFELYDAGTTADAFEKEKDPEREPDKYIYSRYRNPTVVSAEESIMKAEGCSWALLTESGMAAVDTALSIFQNGNETRPWLFFTEIYGGTITFVEAVLKRRRGVVASYFAPSEKGYDVALLEKHLAGLKPGILYVETISNPMLIVADVTAIAEAAHRHGSVVIVDNTFATPWLYRPLDHGADLVIHSATKYFSGHGNISAGVICGNNRQYMKEAIEYRKFVGHMISPDDAYRLQTQMDSFHLRFPRQCENAHKLALFLKSSDKVSRIWYPGLEGHSTGHIAAKLFGGKGFGAMITFDFGGTNDQKRKRRDDFISAVSGSIKLIPTLGDSHTILMPVESVWGVKYPEPGMIRLSVGFEEYDGLIDCVSKAIKSIK